MGRIVNIPVAGFMVADSDARLLGLFELMEYVLPRYPPNVISEGNDIVEVTILLIVCCGAGCNINCG